ncbi:hypothetical protein COOONC_11741 [Cooperia oncophora]
MDIMRDQNGNLLHHNLNFRRHVVPSLQTKYDLVIAHRTLCELGSRESRLETIASLWKRTTRFLVLIESGLHSAFEALMEARDFLLLSGVQLHLQDTTTLLEVGVISIRFYFWYDEIGDVQNLLRFRSFTLMCPSDQFDRTASSGRRPLEILVCK